MTGPDADVALPAAIAAGCVLILCILGYELAGRGWMRSALVVVCLALAVMALVLLASAWSTR